MKTATLKILLTIVTLTLFVTCKKDVQFIYHNGTIMKDTCSSCNIWLIRLDNGVLLEPVNINSTDFHATVVVGQKVRFNYIDTKRDQSLECECLKSKLVKLISIKDN